jgi:Rrf2 family protein
VRAAIALARAWPERRTIRQLATAAGVSEAFTPHVLRSLVRSGLVDARAGRGGGYSLSREPGLIPLLAVVEAAEGSLRTDRCTLRGGPCHWNDVCPLHTTWSEAIGALRDTLSVTTIGDVLLRDLGLEQGVVPIPADSHRRAKSGDPPD